MKKIRPLILGALVACGDGGLPVSAPLDAGDGVESPAPPKSSRLHDSCLVGAPLPDEILDHDGSRVTGIVECVMGEVTDHKSFVTPTMPGTLEVVKAPPEYLLRYQYKYVRVTTPGNFPLTLIYSLRRNSNDTEVMLADACYPNQWCRVPGNAQYVRIKDSPQSLAMVFVTLGEDVVATKYGVGHYFIGWSKEGQPCAGGAFDYSTGTDFPNGCGL